MPYKITGKKGTYIAPDIVIEGSEASFYFKEPPQIMDDYPREESDYRKMKETCVNYFPIEKVTIMM